MFFFFTFLKVGLVQFVWLGYFALNSTGMKLHTFHIGLVVGAIHSFVELHSEPFGDYLPD